MTLRQHHQHVMGIVSAIIIGLIVGAIAKFILPGKDPGGWTTTILLGLAGSFVAHFLGRALGWYGDGEPAGFIASTVGAIILLALYRLTSKKDDLICPSQPFDLISAHQILS